MNNDVIDINERLSLKRKEPQPADTTESAIYDEPDDDLTIDDALDLRQALSHISRRSKYD